MLVKRDGRVGLVLPSGFATDHTAAALRRHLLARSSVDTISGFDNRKAIFPIHRSVRFMICTTTMGAPTSRIACRFGIDDPTVLESIPDAGDRANTLSHPITLTPSLIAALSSDKMTIRSRCKADVRILEGIVHRCLGLGSGRLERAIRPRLINRRSCALSQGREDCLLSKDSPSSLSVHHIEEPAPS